jgi:hypothetical protein
MPTIPNRNDFNQASDEFCLLLQSCGVFESGVMKEPDRVLECIDVLRAMLNLDANQQAEKTVRKGTNGEPVNGFENER